MDAHRQPEQGRHLERFDRANEEDEEGREDRRPRELERDVPQHLEDIRPAHRGRLFERGVHGAKSCRHQQEGHGRVVQPVDPDHSPHRVDVERRALQAEGTHQHQVDDADLRAAEQDPRDREQDAGNDQRDQRQRIEQRLERRVGALVHPRERGADDERERRDAGGELERVPEQPRGVGIRIGRDVVAEREDRRLGGRLRGEEALPEQEAERDDRDVDRERHAGSDDDPLPLERVALLRCGGVVEPGVGSAGRIGGRCCCVHGLVALFRSMEHWST